MRKIILLGILLLSLAKSGQTQNYNMSNSTDTVCSGNFYDNGGSSGNYRNNSSLTHTFIGQNNKRLAFKFSSFRTYNIYDYLLIYDGPNDSYPLIGRYDYQDKIDSIASSGNAITFKFRSGNSFNASGWAASFECFGNALTSINLSNKKDTISREVAFYDDNGPTSNHGASKSITHTFCTDSASKKIIARFNNVHSQLGDNDTLWVYDGPNENSSLIGVYPSGAYIEDFNSSNRCLTFKFKSDANSQKNGWSARLSVDTIGLTALQTYNMSSGVRYICSGLFYDNGGNRGNYSDNSNLSQTFRSKNGERIAVKFTSFNTRNIFDYLLIYDGPNSDYPLIGKYFFNTRPDSLISSGEALTFKFISSRGLNSAGWEAQFSCGGPPLPVINHSNNQIDSICSAVIYDNGGARGHYLANAAPVHTVCSDDTSKELSLSFNHNETEFDSGDTLWAFDGTDTTSPPLGIYSRGNRIERITSSSGCLTLFFKETGNNQADGFQAFASCDSANGVSSEDIIMSGGTRFICDGKFYDAGYTGNYPDNERRFQTLKSRNGKRISVDFTSFRTANSSDYLLVYDGQSRNHPLLARLDYSDNPGKIISSGDALSFYFYSSRGLNHSGWVADIGCEGPVLPTIKQKHGNLDSTCSAVFYDNGGSHKNYKISANPVNTICSSDTNKVINLEFNHLETNFSSGDTLWSFDGKDTTGQPLGIYFAGSRIERIISDTNCVTFQFKEDGNAQADGWQALVSCDTVGGAKPEDIIMSAGTRYICDAKFYDPGYKSNYPDNARNLQTLRSRNQNRLEVNFTSFRTANTFDYLLVYDGATRQHPLIGRYDYRDNPGKIVSSGDALTFYFYSSSGLNDAGWAAEVSCAGPILDQIVHKHKKTDSTCAAVFYDNGGPAKNYFSNRNPIHTICSNDSSKIIKALFNTAAMGLATGDTLIVYDGNDTLSPKIGKYIRGTRMENIFGESGCITFFLKTNGTNNDIGWQAFIECDTAASPIEYRMSSGVRYVCSGTFTDNGGSRGNYSDNTTLTQTFVAQSNEHLQMVFTSFYTRNIYDDLRVYDGPSTSSKQIGRYYYNTAPDTIVSSGKALTFKFSSSWRNNASGWVAKMNCIGPPPKPVIKADRNLCLGDTLSLTANTLSGVRYFWSGPNGFSSNSANPILNGVDTANAGTYKLYVKKWGFTSDTAQFNVSVHDIPNKPNITANGTVEFCSGDSVVLRSNYAHLNKWSTGDTTQEISIKNSKRVSVKRVSDFGCFSAQDDTVVTVQSNPSSPSISKSGTRSFCSGDSVILTSSFWKRNRWNTGDTSRQIVVKQSGNYQVSYTDTNNCSSSSVMLKVNVNPTPNAPTIQNNGNLQFCSGDSVVLNSSYSKNNIWSNGDTSRSVTIKTSGNFYVVHRSDSGCFSDTSATVNIDVFNIPVNPKIQINGDTIFCAGDSVTLSSNSSLFNRWSDGDTSNVRVIKRNAKLSLRLVNYKGCTSKVARTITIKKLTRPATPKISHSRPLQFCSGDSVVLNSNFEDGNIWSNGSTNASITVKKSGTYSLINKSDSGCTSDTTAPVNITVFKKPNDPIIQLMGDTSFCEGDSLILKSSSPLFNRWNDGDTSQQKVIRQSGIYSLRLIDYRACSSKTTKPIRVDVLSSPTPPVLSAGGPLKFCKGDSVVLTSSSAVGNIWSNLDTNQRITVKSSGSYRVAQRAFNGCLSDSSIAVKVQVFPSPPKPDIQVDGDTIFCQGDSVILRSSASDGNLWNDASTLVRRVVKNGGEYSVKVISQDGCESISSMKVRVKVNPKPPKPQINTSGATTFCKGETLGLKSSASQGNVWSTGENTQSIVVDEKGNYFVYVRNSFNCISDTSDVIPVNVIKRPGKPFIIPIGQDSLDAGFDAPGYKWFINGDQFGGGTTRTIYAPVTGDYQVVAFNQNCYGDTSNVYGFIHSSITETSETSLEVYPNPVTDILLIRSAKKIYGLKVYDIRGKLLFSQKGHVRKFYIRDYADGVYILEFQFKYHSHKLRVLKN